MDPNANLQRQERILRHFDETGVSGWTELKSLRSDLLAWLRSGGFTPDWRQGPLASRYFRTKGYRAI